MQIGCGRLQMTSEEFWSATPYEFFNRLKGYSEAVEEANEHQLLNTKLLMYWQLIGSPYIKQNQKPKSFEEFNRKNFGEPKSPTTKRADGKKPNTLTKASLFKMLNIKDESNG